MKKPPTLVYKPGGTVPGNVAEDMRAILAGALEGVFVDVCMRCGSEEVEFRGRIKGGGESIGTLCRKDAEALDDLDLLAWVCRIPRPKGRAS